MTAKAKPYPRPRMRLVDGHIEVPVWRYRILFTNGDIVDVNSPSDDSNLREAVLDSRHHDDDRIAGVAEVVQVGWLRVPEPDPEEGQ